MSAITDTWVLPKYSDPRNPRTLSRSQLHLFASYVATVNRFRGLISLHIRSMWETICDPTASLLGWLSLSDPFSQSDLVFCAFTDVAGSLSQSDLVFCAFTDVAGSLSQSDLVFCAFTDVACGWKWPIFCTGSYPLWRLIFSIRLMF